MSKLLIVIPAHNEEANIVQVVEELTRGYPQYDYVVVNDGSRDKTAALCRAHGYRLIDLPVNLGLAGAFQTGLRFAAENGYDCAMQMDADGQHKPVGDQALAHQIKYQLIRHFADNQTCLVRCIRTREHLPGADAVGARLVGFDIRDRARLPSPRMVDE